MDEGRKEGQALLERRRKEHRAMNWQQLMDDAGQRPVEEALTFLAQSRCVLCGEPAIAPPEAQAPLCSDCAKARLLERERDDRALKRLEVAGLLQGDPAHMTMDSFVRETKMQKRAYEVVRQWWNDWAAQLRLDRDAGYRDSVMLWSASPGTGKTHLARAVQRKLIMAGGYPVFAGVSELLNTLRASYDGEADSQAIIDRLLRSELLLLDDLGKEYVTAKSRGWFKDILWNIINNRHNARRPLFITSNFSPDEVAELIGVYAASRFGEMVESRVCEMSGEDWRMKHDR
jgi:DNA replication protein DnaC